MTARERRLHGSSLVGFLVFSAPTTARERRLYGSCPMGPLVVAAPTIAKERRPHGFLPTRAFTCSINHECQGILVSRLLSNRSFN
jgi:hypothetical protein